MNHLKMGCCHKTTPLAMDLKAVLRGTVYGQSFAQCIAWSLRTEDGGLAVQTRLESWPVKNGVGC